MKVKRFDSSCNDVWKYVFDFGDAIAEAVLYRYGTFAERTVLCVSVQSGCPVGCKFCGTGKQFVRNLTQKEIFVQVDHCLFDMNIVINSRECKKFQIMFMSMGEPMLNFVEVAKTIRTLNHIYPNADLLISTIGPKNRKAFSNLFELSATIDKIGLQFSIHESDEMKRNELIPYKNKYDLREIRNIGVSWNAITNRPVYLNYCVSETNHGSSDLGRLLDLFPPSIFNFTFSVICSEDETMKDKGFNNLSLINTVARIFIESGYNTRVFNPDGQDDIGGGCGQLWYVQEWMRKRNEFIGEK